jgi:hypothetical protein
VCQAQQQPLAGEQQAPALTRGLSAVAVVACVDAGAAEAAGAQHKSMARQAVCFIPVVSVRVWPSLLPAVKGYCDTTPASCSISTGKSSEGNTSPAMRRIWASLLVSKQAALGLSVGSAAVHEVFGDMADFCDVKVRRYRLAVGQHNAQALLWVGF